MDIIQIHVGGRDELRPPNVPATAWPCMKLISDCLQLHHRGCILWADNWFSGVATINAVHAYGVGYVGMARTNRLAKAFNKPPSNWPRGSIRTRSSVNAAVPKVWCTQWQDKKLCSVLSTVPFPTGRIFRKTQRGKDKIYEPKNFTCPAIIGAYNMGKVGTDRMDQQVSAYYKNRRNYAHINWRDLNKKTIKGAPFLDFLMEVIADLAPSRPAPARPTVGIHTPMERGMEPKGCKTKKDHRRMCVVCKRKAGTWCKECNVFLHINTELTGKTCWSAFHGGAQDDHDDSE